MIVFEVGKSRVNLSSSNINKLKLLYDAWKRVYGAFKIIDMTRSSAFTGVKNRFKVGMNPSSDLLHQWREDSEWVYEEEKRFWSAFKSNCFFQLKNYIELDARCTRRVIGLWRWLAKLSLPSVYTYLWEEIKNDRMISNKLQKVECRKIIKVIAITLQTKCILLQEKEEVRREEKKQQLMLQ